MQNMKLGLQIILIFQISFGSLTAFSAAEDQNREQGKYQQNMTPVHKNGSLIQSHDLVTQIDLQETKAAYDEFSHLSKEEQFAEYQKLLMQMESQRQDQIKNHSKLRNVVKRHMGQAVIKLPKEMLVFAISMGAIVAFKLFTNYAQNPIGMLQHLEHQLSPIGALSFYLFIASQGITAEYLTFLLRRPGAAVYINYLAMTVGFTVQSLSAELLADPNVKSCVGTLMTAWNMKKEELTACQNVYTTYATIDKLNQYGPALSSMLISTALSGYGQTKLSQGLAFTAFEVTVRGYEKLGAKLLKSSMFFIPGKLQYTGFKALLAHGFNITLFVGIDQMIYNTVVDTYDNLVQGSWILNNRQKEITEFIYKNDQARWRGEFSEKDIELIEKTNRQISNWKMANLRLVMEANANWKMMLEKMNNLYFATQEFYSMIINSASTYKYDFFERQSLNKAYPLWGVSIEETDLSKEVANLKQGHNQSVEPQAALISAATESNNNEKNKNPYIDIFDLQVLKAAQSENLQAASLNEYAQRLISKYQFNTDLNKKWQFEKPKNQWQAHRPFNLNINISDYNHLRKIVIYLNSDNIELQGKALEQVNQILDKNLNAFNGFAKILNFNDYTFEERCLKVFAKIEASGIDLEKQFGVFLAEIIRLKKRFGEFRPYFNQGEGYVRSLEKSETLKSALSKVEHPSISGNNLTKSVGDYLVSQMICGPSIFEGVLSNTVRGFPIVFNPPRITNVKSDEICNKFLAAQNTSIYSAKVGDYQDNQGQKYSSIWKMVIENIDPNIMGRNKGEGSLFQPYWDKYVTGQMKEAYQVFQEQYKQIIHDLLEKLRPNVGSSFNQGPVANGVLLANFQQAQMNLILFGKILAHNYVNILNKNLPKHLLASRVSDFRVNKNTEIFEAFKKKQAYIFKEQENVMHSLEQLIQMINQIDVKKDKQTGKWHALQLPDVNTVHKSLKQYEASIQQMFELLKSLNLTNSNGQMKLSQSHIAMLELLKNQLLSIGQEMSVYVELANVVDWDSQRNDPKSEEEKQKMSQLIEKQKEKLNKNGSMQY